MKSPTCFLSLLLNLVTITLLFTGRSPAQNFQPARFTVVTEGNVEGPAILLLPGVASSRAVFDAEAKLLAPGYRLYRVQINGFAGQAAGANAAGPVLAPVIEELHQYIAANHIHPAVIGHSLGGLLGLMLADKHPDDITKLMVVDALPFYPLVFNPAATVDSVKPQGEAMRDGMTRSTPEQYSAIAIQSASFLVKDPQAAKLIAESSIASDRTVFANAMYEDMTTDLRPRLPTIQTPTTLLYPYDPASQGADVAAVDQLYSNAFATMPHLTPHRIDSSRHFIMYDQPGEFDEAVRIFLK